MVLNFFLFYFMMIIIIFECVVIVNKYYRRKKKMKEIRMIFFNYENIFSEILCVYINLFMNFIFVNVQKNKPIYLYMVYIFKIVNTAKFFKII